MFSYICPDLNKRTALDSPPHTLGPITRHFTSGDITNIRTMRALAKMPAILNGKKMIHHPSIDIGSNIARTHCRIKITESLIYEDYWLSLSSARISQFLLRAGPLSLAFRAESSGIPAGPPGNGEWGDRLPGVTATSSSSSCVTDSTSGWPKARVPAAEPTFCSENNIIRYTATSTP